MSVPLNRSDSESIMEFLADREGLKGSSRRIYQNLLRNTFGFTATTPWWMATSLACCAAGTAVFGLVFERLDGSGLTFALLWVGVASLGLLLAIGIGCAQHRSRTVEREIEWRAYCLLIRPMILSELPGLLDRNLSHDHGTEDAIDIRPASVAASLLQQRRVNLWLPAAAGWLAGSVALVLWAIYMKPGIWSFGMPILGAAIFPPAWCLFRMSALRHIEHIARRKR